jgi:hypothetical protein
LNPKLYVEYILSYVTPDSHTDFKKTIRLNYNNTGIDIEQMFGIQIQDGYGKYVPRVYISTKQYFTFVSLLKKACKLIQDNIFKFYPNLGSADLETNQEVLHMYQTEKALYSNQIKLYPGTWSDSSGQGYPSIIVETAKGSINLPYEDVLALVELFNTFNPMSFGLQMIQSIEYLNKHQGTK